MCTMYLQKNKMFIFQAKYASALHVIFDCNLSKSERPVSKREGERTIEIHKRERPASTD